METKVKSFASQKKHTARRKTMMITFIYFLFGCIWILTTDFLAGKISGETSAIFLVNIYKGIIYVAITSILIYILIYRALRKLTDSEVRLAESEVLFHTIFEQAPIGIALTGNTRKSRNKLQQVNPMLAQITGRSVEEIENTGWEKITHPQDLTRDLELFDQLILGQIDRYSIEKRYIKPDGSYNWAEITVTPLRIFHDKAPDRYLCLVRDIHEKKTIQDALSESERSKSVLLSNLPGMAYRCKNDQKWTMLFVSEGCKELTGYSSDSLLENKEISFEELILAEYRRELREKWESAIKYKDHFQAEYEIRTAAGEVKWVLEMGQAIYDECGQVIALEGILIDISDRKDKEEMLEYLSIHDSLTGLLNRRHLEDQMALSTWTKNDEKRALILLDLKNLSLLSLTYGYKFSETLIRELSVSLSALTGENCRLFQIAFERLAFYITDYPDTVYLRAFCQRIRNLKEIHGIFDLTGCGIGIVEIDSWGCDAAEAIKNASIAAQHSVGRDLDGCRFFTEELWKHVNRESKIKEILLEAAFTENSESLYLEYQPLVCMKSGKIKGIESLARIRDRRLGNISPSEFIPLSEELKLITPMGYRIIRMAFEMMKKLEETGYKDIRMNVNVSAIQLIQEDFPDEILILAGEAGIDLKNFGLEITESVFSDNYEAINERLGRLKALGVETSIDDFGTGYSSLAREKELNVNYLKIDKVFIDDIIGVNPEKAIVGDIISMAHKMGHFVVAEGVEDKRQYDYLNEHSCDYIQGYYFSKPLPADQMIALLDENHKKRASFEEREEEF